jgi:hypothetical protein
MILVLAVLVSLFSPLQGAEQRIVAASNVRLRSAPTTSAEDIGRLGLGTILNELETSADANWVRVETRAARTGWVYRSLTQPFNDRDAIAIYRSVIQARLKIETLSFDDAAELMEFVSRVTPDVTNSDRAEFELFRLRALERCAHEILSFEPRISAQRDWIAKNEDDIVYSEPAGQWIVRADLYWQLEQQHRGEAIADEIAWQAANAGIPGECEGYIPCEFAGILMTDARYLGLYPSGTRLNEALEHIDYPLREILKPNTPYSMDPRDSAELGESIAKLTAILQRVAAPQLAGMLERLKKIEQTYR